MMLSMMSAGTLLALTACAAPAATEAVWSADGRLEIQHGEQVLTTLSASAFLEGWRGVNPSADRQAPVTGLQRALRWQGPEGEFRVLASVAAVDGGLRVEYTLTPSKPFRVNGTNLSWALPASLWRGGSWTLNTQQGPLPLAFGEVHLAQQSATSATLATPDGLKLSFAFERPTPVLVQDDRRWGPSYTLRLGPSQEPYTWSDPLTVAFTVKAEGGLKLVVDEPVTLAAGADWAPLAGSLDIEPGSALDFSQLGLLDAPAGQHGWLQADAQGRFVFERQPTKPVRFYGVNLCFTALYPDHALADRLAQRLAALGYNNVRIHHYESTLVSRTASDSLTFNPDSLDRLEYLAAALIKRGIYLTTDLYVSRPVRAAEIWPGATGQVGMDEYKLLVLLNPAARENLKAFCRRFFGHTNPYTQRTWAADPALNLLSLVNEGNLLNFTSRLKGKLGEEFGARWNQWLVRRYGDRAKLAAAWGKLPTAQDPAAGNVAVPNPYDGRPGRDLSIFAAELHSAFADDLRKFLREELGTKALLTDLNAWTEMWPIQTVRTHLDYVDSHAYWDHPRFLEKDWQLPTRGGSGGGSAVAADGAQHRDKGPLRLVDKPFGFTEFNYAAPNAFRAESGPLMGGYGALQAWDGIWRFAYSHSLNSVGQPGAINFFDVASDPTTQASDRWAVLLFRRDAATARTLVTLTADPAKLLGDPTGPAGMGALQDLTQVVRVGSRLTPAKASQGEVQLPLTGGPIDLSQPGAQQKVLDRLRADGLLGTDNGTDLAKQVFVSDTGQLRLESKNGLFTFATPGSVGVFSSQGRPAAAGPLSVKPSGGPVAVYVASLSAAPVADSPRLLLAHIPEIQDTGMKFGERRHLTLLAWGRLPHLVHDLSTSVALKLASPGSYHVIALSGSGAPLGAVESKVVDGALTFTARPRWGEQGCIYYEIVRR